MKFLNSIWNSYKSFAHKIGIFQSKLILSIFYFLLTPFGIFFTFFKDELKMKNKPESTWVNKSKQSEKLADLQSQ